METKIQSVVISFKDGSKAFFTGKAICYPGDNRKIDKIQFTEPRGIPDDYKLEEIPLTENFHA